MISGKCSKPKEGAKKSLAANPLVNSFLYTETWDLCVVLQQIVACYQFPPCKWCNHLKNWLLFLTSPTVDEKLGSNKKWHPNDSYAKFPCFNRNRLKDFRSYVRALSQGACDFFTKWLPDSRVICRNNMASAPMKLRQTLLWTFC